MLNSHDGLPLFDSPLPILEASQNLPCPVGTNNSKLAAIHSKPPLSNSNCALFKSPVNKIEIISFNNLLKTIFSGPEKDKAKF